MKKISTLMTIFIIATSCSQSPLKFELWATHAFDLAKLVSGTDEWIRIENPPKVFINLKEMEISMDFDLIGTVIYELSDMGLKEHNNEGGPDNSYSTLEFSGVVVQGDDFGLMPTGDYVNIVIVPYLDNEVHLYIRYSVDTLSGFGPAYHGSVVYHLSSGKNDAPTRKPVKYENLNL